MFKLHSTSASEQAEAANEVPAIMKGSPSPTSAGMKRFAAATIPTLVTLLASSSDEEVLRAVAVALRHLGSEAMYAIMIAETGGVPVLVKLLQCGPVPVQGEAAVTLAHLMSCAGHTPATLGAAAQAIPSALQMLRRDPNFLHREAAMLFLTDLIAFEGDSRAAVAQADGAIPLIVQMLGSISAALQEQSARAIRGLVFSEQTKSITHFRDSVLAAGTIPRLVQILLQPGSEEAEHMAVEVLLVLSWDVVAGPEASVQLTCSRMAEAGAIPPLVKLLTSKNTKTKEAALRVVAALSRSACCCLSMLAMRAIPRLVQLLEDASERNQVHAMLALSNIAWQNEDILSEVIAAGAISPLVRISMFASKASVQAHAARTLAFFGGEGLENRRKIAAAKALHLSALEHRLNSNSATEREQRAQQPLPHGTSSSPGQAAGSQCSDWQLLRDLDRAFHNNRPDEIKAVVIMPILQVLWSSNSAPAAMILELQEKAAAELRNLAEESPELCAVILSAGASPVLSKLMETSGSEAVRREAGKALRSLLRDGATPAAPGLMGAAEAVGLEAVRLMAETMSLSECPNASGAMRTEAARLDVRKRSRGDT